MGATHWGNTASVSNGSVQTGIWRCSNREIIMMKVKWTYEGSSLEYIHWIFFTKNWGSWRFVLDSNGRSSTESIGWFGLLLSSLRKDCVSSYSEFQTLESTAKSGLVLPTWLIQLNWTIKKLSIWASQIPAIATGPANPGQGFIRAPFHQKVSNFVKRRGFEKWKHFQVGSSNVSTCDFNQLRSEKFWEHLMRRFVKNSVKIWINSPRSSRLERF